MKKKTTILLASLLVIGALEAQATSFSTDPQNALELFHPIVPGKTETLRDASPDGAGLALNVSVDVEALAANPERLALSLPGGDTVTLSRARSIEKGDGDLVWYGRTSGEKEWAIFNLRQGQVSGTISSQRARYHLDPTDQEHQLTTVRTYQKRKETLPYEEATHAPQPQEPRQSLSKSSLYQAYSIDVMAVYPISSLGGSDNAVFNYVSEGLGNATLAFSNSGLSVSFNLVHVGPLIEAQPPANLNVYSAKGWLNSQSPTQSEVATLRNTYGADMVILVIPPSPDNECGIANIRLAGGVADDGQPFGDRAFSAVELGCGAADFTIAHELGHNFGMQHSPMEFQSEPLLTPAAQGFESPSGSVATLMACADGGPSISGLCDRVLYLSSPQFVITDPNPAAPPSATVTLGSATQKNRDTAATTASANANLRPSNIDAPPSIQIISPTWGQSVPFQTAFRLSGWAVDAEDGFLSPQISWSSDRLGYLASGRTPTVTFGLSGTHLLTASVTDSTGKTARATVLIVVADPNPPTQFIGVPSSQQNIVFDVDPFQVGGSPSQEIHGWATDSSGVTSVTAKLYVLYGSTKVFVGSPAISYGTPRGDVCQVYSQLADPNCPNVGWSGYLTAQPTGSYRLEIRAQDAQANVSVANRNFKITRRTTVKVAEDAWVREDLPYANYGSSTILRLRSVGTGYGRHTYTKFHIPYLGAPIQKATLKGQTGSVSLPWLSIYLMADNNWSEATINWASASLQQYGLVSAGAQPANSSVLVPLVTSGGYPLVTNSGDTVTLGLVSANAPNQLFYSKEYAGGSVALELILEY